MIFIEGPAILFYGASFCEDLGENNNTEQTFVQKTPTCLGITESGVQIAINNLTTPVNTDDMGGTEGFPAEIINMAATANIRGVLVDYNAHYAGNNQSQGQQSSTFWKAVNRNLERGIYSASGSSNTSPPIGSSYFGDNYGFSLRISGTTSSYVFPRCSLLDSPREFNLSTGAKKTSFTFTAYPIFKFAIGSDNGENRCQKAWLYRKISYGATFTGCHDSIGGFEWDVNADGDYHSERLGSDNG